MDLREEDSRTAILLGADGIRKLKAASIAIFGLGGVGGAVCESLARIGIGNLTLFDADTVSLSNINRQICALHSTVGQAKTDVWSQRIKDINPDCNVTVHRVFYLPENADLYPLDGFTYVVDAIDTVSAKIELVLRAKQANVPIISAMGAGNKLDPSAFRIADLSKTSGCPLARTMRRELRQRGILHLDVVFSPEEPLEPKIALEQDEISRKTSPGSLPYVTPIPGYLMAAKIVRDLTQN